MQVYISGPITGIPKFEIMFNRQEALLKKMGYQVSNPAKFAKELEDDIRYRFGRLPTYNEYLKFAIKKLLDCDGISMLPNWEQSKGASAEYYLAVALNYTLVEVKNAFAQ